MLKCSNIPQKTVYSVWINYLNVDIFILQRTLPKHYSSRLYHNSILLAMPAGSDMVISKGLCCGVKCQLLREPGPWFNIKMSSYQYRKSHCGDKTVIRSSYLHNGTSYTGKMASLYWISPLKSTMVLMYNRKPMTKQTMHEAHRWNMS